MCDSDASARAARAAWALSVVLLVGLAAGGPSPAAAQAKKDDAAREQLRRAQQAVRKAEEGRAAAERERQALAEQVEKLGRETQAARESAARSAARAGSESRRNAELERSLAAARQEAEGLRREKSGLEAALAKLRAEAEAVAARSKEQGVTIESRDEQAKRLLARTALQEKRVGACEAANAKLHEAGLQCLARYERDVLPGLEPFAQLRRVELENMLEQYRDRFDEHRLTRGPR